MCGYPSRTSSEKLLVMLQAFVDDSINPTGDRRLYLAAYVQTADAWASFSDAWAAVLKDEPAIESFHMVEAQNRRGPFAGWSEAKRTKKVFALAQVIREYSPWGIHASVSVTEFDRILKPVSPHPIATPYFSLFYAIIFGVARVHKKLGVEVPCDFIFDEHDGLANKVFPFWDLMGDELDPDLRPLIGGQPIFRNDLNVLPLQAADMLAWHVRRDQGGRYPTEYEGLVDLITMPDAHHCVHLDAESMEAQAEVFRQMPQAAAPSSKAEFRRFTRELGPEWQRFFQPETDPWAKRP